MSWVINNHIRFVPSCLCTCWCLRHYLCHLVTSDILWVRVCIRFQHPQEKQRSENVNVTRVRGIHNDQFTSIMIGIPVIQDIVTPRDFISPQLGILQKQLSWGVFFQISYFSYIHWWQVVKSALRCSHWQLAKTDTWQCLTQNIS